MLMKIIYLTLFGLFILFFSACNSEDKREPEQEGRDTQEVIDNGTEGGDQELIVNASYLYELKSYLQLSDDQIEQIEMIQTNHIKSIKQAGKKSERTKLVKEMNVKIKNLLNNDIEAFKKFKNFNRTWSNPLSLMHLSGQLKLSNRQLNQIKLIKKNSANQIWNIKKGKSKDLEAQIVAVRNQEEKRIMSKLSARQKEKYIKIKSTLSAESLKNILAFQ
jgi:predicted transcriptional regulator